MRRIINNRIISSTVGLCSPAIHYEIFRGSKDVGIILIPPSPAWEGGNMHNNLIKNMFINFINLDIPVMRFSFPPVDEYSCGSDDSQYKNYIYYTSLCIDEFLSRSAPIKTFVLVGYSFGSLLALNLFLRREEVNTFVMISPALNHYDYVTWLSHNKSTGLLIYGSSDYSVSSVSMNKFIGFLKDKDINVVIEEMNTTHLMDKKDQVITDKIISFINSNFPDNDINSKSK
jgi:alpha/beta superfamily hydrolase